MNENDQDAMDEMETLTDEQQSDADEDTTVDSDTSDAGDDTSKEDEPTGDENKNDDDESEGGEQGEDAEKAEGQEEEGTEEEPEEIEKEQPEINPVQKRINEISAKKRESDERADRAETDNLELKREIAQLKADKLDPLDYETDDEYDEAKQEALGEFSEDDGDKGQGKGDEKPMSDSDQQRYWDVEEASNEIFMAAEKWPNAPSDYAQTLKGKPFTDDVVMAVAVLKNPAQVAYELARRPGKLNRLGAMEAEKMQEQLKAIDDVASEMKGQPKPQTKDDDGPGVERIASGKPGGAGMSNDPSFDDLESQQKKQGSVW